MVLDSTLVTRETFRAFQFGKRRVWTATFRRLLFLRCTLTRLSVAIFLLCSLIVIGEGGVCYTGLGGSAS